MMDVRLLNANWETIGIIDTFTSLIWRRRYYTCGDFELHCQKSDFGLLMQARYLVRADADEIGVCENPIINNDSAAIKGRFAESILSNRVISAQRDFSAKTQGQIAVLLVNEFCSEVSAQTSTLGTSTSAQVTGDNLMDYTYKLLQEAELSQRVRRVNGSFVYEVWQGLDRTQTQTVNPWAVFSPDWDNLVSFSYERSTKDIKNFAYVAGEGEGSDRVIVTVDLTNGEERHELWVDARDLRKEDGESTANYKAKLTQRGKEKLAEYCLVEKVDAEVDTRVTEYKVKYDLGDICTIKHPEYGIEVVKRIEGIDEVYENGGVKINATFGSGFLLLPQYIKRSLT